MTTLIELQSARQATQAQMDTFNTKLKEVYGIGYQLLEQEPATRDETLLQAKINELELAFDETTTLLTDLEQLDSTTVGALHSRWISDDLRQHKLKRQLDSTELKQWLARNEFTSKMKDEMLV